MPAASDDERLVPVAALEGDDGVLDWDDTPAWDEGSRLAESLGMTETAVPAPRGDWAGPG